MLHQPTLRILARPLRRAFSARPTQGPGASRLLARPALLATCALAVGALVGCDSQTTGEAAAATDGSTSRLDRPSVLVHAPTGWRPTIGYWAVSSGPSGFAFMDMSYRAVPLRDRGVYVCIEAAREAACPAGSPYVFLDQTVGLYHVSISQEREPDVAPDKALAHEWRKATVDFN